VHGRLRSDSAALDLEGKDSPIFELQLPTEERLRLEDAVVGCTGWHQQLDFAASDLDVDGFVALRIVVEGLRWIASWLTHERLLHVASLHANLRVRTKYARVHLLDS